MIITHEGYRLTMPEKDYWELAKGSGTWETCWASSEIGRIWLDCWHQYWQQESEKVSGTFKGRLKKIRLASSVYQPIGTGKVMLHVSMELSSVDALMETAVKKVSASDLTRVCEAYETLTGEWAEVTIFEWKVR